MAKIDTSKIEGFDKMTPEEQVAALTAFEYEDNRAEIDRLKNANTKANKEAAEWKRKHNALLDEDEQKKQADAETLTNLQAEVETLRKEKAESENKAKFLSLGYTEELAVSSAKALAAGDNKTLFENSQKHLEAFSKTLKAEALKDTPRPPAGNGSEGMDYRKKIEEAQAAGNMSDAAYYTRLMAEEEARANTQ